jgi:hypothetical protein
MRIGLVIALLAGLVVLAGSFGVAAAGERKAPVTFEGDCGCTGGARAKDRIEKGLVHVQKDEDARR